MPIINALWWIHQNLWTQPNTRCCATTKNQHQTSCATRNLMLSFTRFNFSINFIFNKIHIDKLCIYILCMYNLLWCSINTYNIQLLVLYCIFIIYPHLNCTQISLNSNLHFSDKLFSDFSCSFPFSSFGFDMRFLFSYRFNWRWWIADLLPHSLYAWFVKSFAFFSSFLLFFFLKIGFGLQYARSAMYWNDWM